MSNPKNTTGSILRILITRGGIIDLKSSISSHKPKIIVYFNKFKTVFKVCKLFTL